MQYQDRVEGRSHALNFSLMWDYFTALRRVELSEWMDSGELDEN